MGVCSGRQRDREKDGAICSPSVGLLAARTSDWGGRRQRETRRRKASETSGEKRAKRQSTGGHRGKPRGSQGESESEFEKDKQNSGSLQAVCR